MKLLESLKTDSKKRSILIGILAITILSAVISVCIGVSLTQKNKTTPTQPNDQQTESDDTPVFLPIDKSDETQEPDTPSNETDKPSNETAPPVDLSGINGLEYVSLGNGTCYINSLGSCAESNLEIPAYSPSGDKVVRLADAAFKDCASLITVKIPYTVTSIGMGVFRGCSSLEAITVADENTVYCSENGVLFSIDKSVLVCVPVNFAKTDFLLKEEVVAVAAFAFEGVKNIRAIFYQGTVDEFQEIDFLTGNDVVKQLRITCNYYTES